MADNRESPHSSTPGWLFFVVGALVVAVFILGYFWFESGDGGKDVNFTVEVPTESTGGDQGTAGGGGQATTSGGGQATTSGGGQGNASGTSN